MAKVTQICEYRDVIDVRSPDEYRLDHIPGAVNLPVFSNSERARIGTLYKTDPLSARRLGAALFSANIVAYLKKDFMDCPADWAPLIYCARGGQRSGGMVEVLRRIGWRASQLDGGYKAYRHYVINAIDAGAQQQWIVIAGKTGTGKTRLLTALANTGAQTMDLEQLANHRGSVFGESEQAVQPSQRQFESRLAARFAELQQTRPVFIEAESRKIGAIHLPSGLLTTIRRAPTLYLSAPLAARVRYILEDYNFFRQTPERFTAALNRLKPFAGNKRLAGWQSLYNAEQWPQLISELLTDFYDIGYEKSLHKNYTGASTSLELDPGDIAAVATMAESLCRRYDPSAEKAAKRAAGRGVPLR